jgi:hypothetical protein
MKDARIFKQFALCYETVTMLLTTQGCGVPVDSFTATGTVQYIVLNKNIKS